MRLNLRNRGLLIRDSCVLCEEASESIEHIFSDCMYVRACWHHMDQTITARGGQSFKEWFFKLLEDGDAEKTRKVGAVIWGV